MSSEDAPKKFTDLVKPPQLEDLPPEEKWQLDEKLRKQMENENAAYGKIGGDEEEETDDKLTTGQKFFADKATNAMVYWSQFTHYSLELEDGTKLRIYRVPASKRAKRAIELLAMEIALGKNDDGKKYTVKQFDEKNQEMETLRVNTYLRDEKTDKPPTMEQIMSVADSTEIDGILEACSAVTLSKWTQGKN